MKKQQIVGVVLAATLAGGIGVLASVLTGNSPAAADPSNGSSQVEAPTTAADLELAPGVAGPVAVGDSKAEALETGLFDADVQPVVDGCAVVPLAWKKPFAPTFDIYTLPNGDVASIGVHEAGPKTADGLGVGSSAADVLAATKGKAVEAGYGQSAVLTYDAASKGWIGYLFDSALSDLSDNDKVTFIEVTEGEKPSMMRDGC